MSDEYNGPECQQKHVINNHKPRSKVKLPKQNHSIRFQNAEGYEVGVMDFSGAGLMFEGNAEEGAIVFMDWVSKTFMARLQEEYDRGFEAGKAAK